MSEYWKSLPRKFCEACKCWFADNKASVEFHERGRRHQEAVKRRLETLRRKGQKEFKAKQKLNQQIQKIERDALKAFKKDVEINPELQEACDAKTMTALASVTPSGAPPPASSSTAFTMGIIERRKHIAKGGKASKDDNESISSSIPLFEPTVLRTWYEAFTEEGQRYFWNIETNETSWEVPIAFVSYQEQREKEAKKRLELSHKYASQATPYGQWTVVESEKKPVDLQLPVQLDEELGEEEVTIEIPAEEEKNRFKEKTLASSSCSSVENSAPVSFKKRKFGSNVKRSVRQRFEDE